MATERVCVNIDRDIRQRTKEILAKTGMDMTTVIDLLLREERIPLGPSELACTSHESCLALFNRPVRAKRRYPVISVIDPA